MDETIRREIDSKGYTLISSLSTIQVLDKKSIIEEGSMKERSINTMNIPSQSFTERTEDHLGSTVSMFIRDKDEKIGFNDAEYNNLENLAAYISSIEHIQPLASFYFIQEKILKWAVSVYKTKKANISLSDFIQREIENNTKIYVFRFPVINLHIESQFNIGKVKFMFFTEKDIDIINNNMSEKDLASYFRNKYQGQVFAEVSVKAEKIKAESLAQTYAQNSLDMLKLYSPSMHVPKQRTMFDLNFRLTYQIESDFLMNVDSKPFNFSIKHSFENYPFEIRNQWLEIVQWELDILSDYIFNLDKENELGNILKQSIHMFATAISNWDLNLRCVNMITILESILLKTDEEKDMERRTKSRLAKIMYELNENQEKVELKEIFTHIYQVRHKMIHKARRIDIQQDILVKAQVMMRILFFRLIYYSKDFNTKSDLIEYLNSMPS